MALRDISLVGDPANQVDISSTGTIAGTVTVNNGGVVKFNVDSYPIDPGTGTAYNVCTITLTSASVAWSHSSPGPAGGVTGTIKVGQGG